MKFCEEVKQWRKSKGLLLKEAADTLKVPMVTYCMWEYCKKVPHELSKPEIRRRMAAYKPI